MHVKICGLTSVEDALTAAGAGADWIGLNFYPPSPRYIEHLLAREIIASLPRSAEAVGLFVNHAPNEIARVADTLGLRIVQLHGQEEPEDLVGLAHLKVVKAFRLDDMESIGRMLEFIKRATKLGVPPESVLIDGHVPGSLGGTGVLIADDILSLLPSIHHLILAGGLTPENVAERIRLTRPWMVDVASGVESAPGKKDPSKVKKFISEVRGVDLAGSLHSFA